jgi:hypothetical protein
VFRFVTLSIVAALATPAGLSSQTGGIDSARALDAVREAQASFERTRRAELPRAWSPSGRCDEHIGRFCYWYDDGDTSLPAEPAPVARARARLLDHLSRIQHELPGDDWIAGQRVRYWVEHPAGHDSAARAADECRGTPWWCAALRGYALHAAERYAEADSVFGAALDLMPDETRCEWIDWRQVLESKLAERFDDLDCEGRRALGDSVLWLARPRWSEPGNDLRTELDSRRVINALLEDSRSPQAMPWGSDLAELTLRYGWPVAWSVADRSYQTLEPASVVGHDRTPAFAFIPRATGDSGAAGYRWELQPDRPRARYAPAYADAVVTIADYQVARFVRGDSTIVVAAVDLAGDTTFRRAGMNLALAVAPAWLIEPVVTRRDAVSVDDAAIQARVAGRPVAVSIEATAPGTRRLARARRLLDPIERTPGLTVSDPLLFRAGDELPRSLAEAADRAIGTLHLSQFQPVGVYWEIQGADADSVEIGVAMIPERRGLLGRIAQGLSLVKHRAPLTLAWNAADPDGRVLGRAFELDLSRLGRGGYTLRLTATTPSGLERTVERSIVLDH